MLGHSDGAVAKIRTSCIHRALVRPTLYRSPAHSYSVTTAHEHDPKSLRGPRWLHDHRARLGRCISFGLKPAQLDQVCRIAGEVATDWRALLLGPEGFLTSAAHAGLLRHAVQWGEQDSMGHVNNVVYNRWAESARVNWVQNYARRRDPANAAKWEELATPTGKGMILRSIKTDFKFPMKYPDRVSVFHKLASPATRDNDAFTLDVVIVSERERRISARLVEDIVLYDYQRARKTIMADLPFMLQAFEKTLGAQAEESDRRLAQRGRLSAAVRDLEVASWDRPDAKEDLGSAG